MEAGERSGSLSFRHRRDSSRSFEPVRDIWLHWNNPGFATSMIRRDKQTP
jgi:hypothetical protein